MSNDRIWIECSTCGEKILLSKHTPGCDLGCLYHDQSKVIEFITEHLNHHPELFSMDLNGNPGLIFKTDNDAGEKH